MSGPIFYWRTIPQLTAAPKTITAAWAQSTSCYQLEFDPAAAHARINGVNTPRVNMLGFVPMSAETLADARGHMATRGGHYCLVLTSEASLARYIISVSMSMSPSLAGYPLFYPIIPYLYALLSPYPLSFTH